MKLRSRNTFMIFSCSWLKSYIIQDHSSLLARYNTEYCDDLLLYIPLVCTTNCWDHCAGVFVVVQDMVCVCVCVCYSPPRSPAGHPAAFPYGASSELMDRSSVGLKPHHTLHTGTARPQPLSYIPYLLAAVWLKRD